MFRCGRGWVGGICIVLGVGGCLSPGAGKREVAQRAGGDAVSNQQRGLVNVQRPGGAAAAAVAIEAGGHSSPVVTSYWQGLDRNTLLLLVGMTILVSQLIRDTVRGMFRMLLQLIGPVVRKPAGGTDEGEQA